MNELKISHYTFQDIAKLRPLLFSYSRSIKWVYEHLRKLIECNNNLKLLQTADQKRKKKIEQLIERTERKVKYYRERFQSWHKELHELGCIICDIRNGYIDIPIYDKVLESSIMICYGHNDESYKWHIIGNSSKNRAEYWKC